MDQQQHNQPMSDNDDIAKALNGGLQFEETPMPGDNPTASSTTDEPADDAPMPTLASDTDSTPPTISPTPSHDDAAATPADEPTEHADKKDASTASDEEEALEKIKTSALDELRPLVTKLDLPAEEKFDTLLLIIRSTDDQSLLKAAHAAAKEITDDTRRAQALLDIVKEIDYFSTKR